MDPHGSIAAPATVLLRHKTFVRRNYKIKESKRRGVKEEIQLIIEAFGYYFIVTRMIFMNRPMSADEWRYLQRSGSCDKRVVRSISINIYLHDARSTLFIAILQIFDL